MKCWPVKYTAAVAAVVRSALRVAKPSWRASKNAMYMKTHNIKPRKNGRSRPDSHSIKEKLLQIIICSKKATYAFIISISRFSLP